MCYNKNNEVLHLIGWAKTQPDFHSKPVEHKKEPIRFSLFVKSFRDVRGQRPSENYSSERRCVPSSQTLEGKWCITVAFRKLLVQAQVCTIKPQVISE